MLDNTAPLKEKLDHGRVKKFGNNVGSKSGLSYLEGHDVIREMNAVFDFQWARHTEDLRVCHEGQTNDGKHLVAYTARVRVIVNIDGVSVSRDGIGFGSGISRISVADAHESAAKEAETDATKRACMTLGDRFGLALYDKEQANVTKERNVRAEKVKLVQLVSSELRLTFEQAATLVQAELADTPFESLADPEQWGKELITRRKETST